MKKIEKLIEALNLCLPYVPVDGDLERDIREKSEDALKGELNFCDCYTKNE